MDINFLVVGFALGFSGNKSRGCFLLLAIVRKMDPQEPLCCIIKLGIDVGAYHCSGTSLEELKYQGENETLLSKFCNFAQ